MPVNLKLLQPQVQKFILDHLNDDLPKLIFKGSPFKNIDIKAIARQIKGKQVARKKFLELYRSDNVIYPPKLNLEQASSQTTAKYKSKFIKPNQSLIDLTGGLGLDSMAFAQKASMVTYCEIQPDVFEIAKYNFEVLNYDIHCQCGDAISFLKASPHIFDWIFIDPSRRDNHLRKLFRLEDCTPNILNHLELFKTKSRKLMLKASPLLDLKYCLSSIPYVKEIHVVALKNEVKEILVIINFEKNYSSPILKAVNLETAQQDFTIRLEDINIKPELSQPQQFLYEPNSALMKLGAFGMLAQKYHIKALAQDSHLMTSSVLIQNFCGRIFEIKACISPKKHLLKQHLPKSQANISCRNYPLKPQEIKTKYGLKDGGNSYVFFTTNYKNQKIVLICNKIES